MYSQNLNTSGILVPVRENKIQIDFICKSVFSGSGLAGTGSRD